MASHKREAKREHGEVWASGAVEELKSTALGGGFLMGMRLGWGVRSLVRFRPERLGGGVISGDRKHRKSVG